MVGHGRSCAGSYLADPTSPIPSYCAVIILFKSVPVHQLSNRVLCVANKSKSLLLMQVVHSHIKLKTVGLICRATHLLIEDNTQNYCYPIQGYHIVQSHCPILAGVCFQF